MADADEMVSQMRELVDRNIEQARDAYTQYLNTVAEAMRVWTDSPNVESGFKHVQDLAMRFAKENGDSAFNLGKELAAAKDLPQLLSVQNRYAQEQMQTYARQAQELTQAMMEATRGAMERQASRR